VVNATNEGPPTTALAGAANLLPKPDPDQFQAFILSPEASLAVAINTGATGVILLEAADAADVPAVLVAVTVNV
jgi:hypothetical protein